MTRSQKSRAHVLFKFAYKPSNSISNYSNNNASKAHLVRLVPRIPSIAQSSNKAQFPPLNRRYRLHKWSDILPSGEISHHRTRTNSLSEMTRHNVVRYVWFYCRASKSEIGPKSFIISSSGFIKNLIWRDSRALSQPPRRSLSRMSSQMLHRHRRRVAAADAASYCAMLLVGGSNATAEYVTYKCCNGSVWFRSNNEDTNDDGNAKKMVIINGIRTFSENKRLLRIYRMVLQASELVAHRCFRRSDNGSRYGILVFLKRRTR
ncbi:hypothetical protein TcasGA2_TC013439 [Tribolium castaneum]|uniref:Uncharacterized protein n=1 Tax=Tribolium castaneum TaxID=7070 RepID=D6WLI0_TRICA|nr:hypothetical protein TcasGA2_TC013439 [Tribolium castaneum]